METHILLKAADWDGLTEERYRQLCGDLRGHKGYRVALLLDAGKDEDKGLPAGVDGMVFRRPDLLGLVRDREYYPRSSKSWRDAGKAAAMSLLPLLLYASASPADRYWQVEDDVYLHGSWADFFGAFEASGADLIASHVREPGGKEWTSRSVRMEGAFAGRPPLRYSLNCVCGVSRRLAENLLAGYAEGMYGHFECVVATRCARVFGDGSLEDISWGSYCRPANLRRFYWWGGDRTDADGRFEWDQCPAGVETIYAVGKLYHAVKREKKKHNHNK